MLIDTSFARRGPSGTAVYVEALTRALREEGVEVVEAARDGERRRGGGGPRSLANAATDHWWTAVELPRRAWQARADVLHHPLPALARRSSVAQVVTVHDLAFERRPEAFDPRFALWARRAHRAAARGAQAVVCVSETTAADARARWGLDPERVFVARHGPGQPLGVAERREPEHFLYVGDDEPRKNLQTLLAAHALYAERVSDPLTLVLAGMAADGRGRRPDSPRYQEVIAPAISTGASPPAGSAGESGHAPAGRLIHEAHSTPERLAELHAGAAALVHPAWHEGFGMTILEAMGAGTPVLAARSPGVVETAGDAARLFDPGDPTGLADALAELAGDATQRARLAERGRRRAAEFSWKRCARDHVRAYTVAGQCE